MCVQQVLQPRLLLFHTERHWSPFVFIRLVFDPLLLISVSTQSAGSGCRYFTRQPRSHLRHPHSSLRLEVAEARTNTPLPSAIQDESQVAEWLGSRASNQKVAGSISGRANDVVSLGKALHPTCFRGMSLYLL